MFDILLTLIFFVAFFFIQNIWVKICLFVVLLMLILPGLYAMFTGAPFVPTGRKERDIILRLGKFNKKDVVVDLGCGDGRVIRDIAISGVKQAIGYEYSFPTYLFALWRKFLARTKEKIVFADFWKQDFSGVNKIVCFLLTDSMRKFEKEIWPNLKKGTVVISHAFKMKNVSPVAVEGSVIVYKK